MGLSRVALDDDRLLFVLSAEEAGRLWPDDALLVEDTWNRIGLAVDGVPCARGEPTIRRVEADGIALSGASGCPAGGTLVVVGGHLQALLPGHETEVVVDGRIVATLDRSGPIARVAAPHREEADRRGLLALLGVLCVAAVGLVAWSRRLTPPRPPA